MLDIGSAIGSMVVDGFTVHEVTAMDSERNEVFLWRISRPLFGRMLMAAIVSESSVTHVNLSIMIDAN